MKTHHLVASAKNTGNRHFSFDFRQFCDNLNAGRTQAACSSHKKMAPSTFSAINETEAETELCRAPRLTFLVWTAQRLQALGCLLGHIAHPAKSWGRAVWTDLVLPAFFLTRSFFPIPSFLFRKFSAISSVPLTSRGGRRAAFAPDCTRPIFQKGAPC